MDNYKIPRENEMTEERMIELIKNHLDELNGEQLRNKKIPVRAEQMMKGNKLIFIRNTEQFLDLIDIETYDTHKQFIDAFESSLANLSKINKKSNFILNEFFSDNIYEKNQSCFLKQKYHLKSSL